MKVYARKTAIVTAEIVTAETRLETVLKDGTLETVNTAHAGDYIVTNPNGERYTMSAEKFTKRYALVSGNTYQAIGEGWFKALTEDTEIVAPWGEKQFIRKGGYLNVTNPADVYGIAGEEFNQTYGITKIVYAI